MSIEYLEEAGWRIDEKALEIELEIAEQSEILDNASKLKEYLLNVSFFDKSFFSTHRIHRLIYMMLLDRRLSISLIAN